jgi:zinc protease
MGFLRDIEDMPNQFDYSRLFFDRYYRPEYTTIIVAGDVNQQRVRAMVEKYWGGWKRGSFRAEIPAEPAPGGSRTNEVKWPTPTLPWLAVSFRGPAYSDTEEDQAALDILAYLAFSPASELYQKLYIQDQKVDNLEADNPDRVDPYLFTINARVKKESDLDQVRQQILATCESFKEKPVEADRLEAVKKHLRYSFALQMDNSEAIASTLARYVALRRTPETLNRLYDLYAKATPTDIRKIAAKYFVEKGRTIVTLKGGNAK